MNKGLKIFANLLILLLFMPSLSFAQKAKMENIEKQLLKNKKENEVKVDLLNKLGVEIYSTNNLRADSCANAAMELAKKINYQKGVAESFRVKCVCVIRSNVKQALEYFESAYNIAQEINDISGIASYGCDISQALKSIGEVNKSDSLLSESLNKAIQADDSIIMLKAYVYLSNNQMTLGKYNDIIDRLTKWKDKALRFEEYHMLTLCYDYLAQSYLRIGNTTKALDYALSSLPSH